MRIFDLFCFKYNRTDFHELNLDWIISDLRTLAETLENFISLNTIKYADPIQWNITKQYGANTVVIDANDGTAYLSVKPVPSGVALSNTDYWTPIFTLNILSANQNITLRDDGSNVLATFASAADDWLIWNGILYKVSQPIAVNEAYVPGYNLDRYSVELFIKDYITALQNEIGNLSDLNTTDKSSIVNSINSINQSLFINPVLYGAKLDGVTDDTAAISAALAKGNVRFPKGSTVLLNDLSIPSNRVIDFNDSTVQTGGTAIKVGDINDSIGYNYTHDIIVTNAIFKLQSSQIALDIANSILCRFRNIRTDNNTNLPTSATVFKITNCFNLSFDEIFISGPSNTPNVDSTAFYFDGDDTKGIVGTNVLTNIKMSNVLIQRVANGIVFHNTSTARYDTFEIDNIGFSHVTTAINMDTSIDVSVMRMLTIRNMRCELSETAIINRGIMELDGSYFYQNDYPIVNHGNLNVLGTINMTGAVITAIESDGVIDFRHCICGLSNAYTYALTGVCYNFESDGAITINQNGGLPTATQRPEPIDFNVNFGGTEIYYASMIAPLTPRRKIKVKHTGAITVYVTSTEYFTVAAHDYLEFYYDGNAWLINTSGVHTV